MDDEREHSPWRLWLSAGLMIGFAALGLSLLFSASDRSTVPSVRPGTQVIRPIEATPATSVVAKPIEQVQAGERVLSRDEHTGELVLRPVAQTFVRASDHLRLLTLRTSAGVDEQIETTDEHPFWVEGTGWTAAKSLQAGQRLTEPDGSIATVVASARVEQPDGVTVYNFEVEDTHSYFVAARGSRGPPVWVHNADGYDDAISGGPAPRSASESLPRLKGKSEHQVRKILTDAGYTRTHVSNSVARNEKWKHADGSEVRIHPYGNQNQAPYRSANNAHIHKEDPLGNQLNDRGWPSIIPADTHIGIRNPSDLPIIRGRPHGAGTE
jgi:hypothetical protein